MYWDEHYGSSEDYGQVAISLGNGQTSATAGGETMNQPIGFRATTGTIGWVLPY